jgi:hypothetical protein
VTSSSTASSADQPRCLMAHGSFDTSLVRRPDRRTSAPLRGSGDE